MKAFTFGVVAALVVAASGAAIIKILEKPTTSCVSEVAELTTASDVTAAILMAPESTVLELSGAISDKTKVMAGHPYVMVAALSNDGMTMYIKVLLDESAKYPPEVEAEVIQIRGSLHKDESQCSMGGKKYDIYRAKTLMESIKTSNPI